LKEVVDQQQSALQAVQQQLQQTQQQLQQTQQQLKTTQQTAQQADAKAMEVENSSNLKVQKVQSDLADVKTALSSTETIVKKTKRRSITWNIQRASPTRAFASLRPASLK